MTHSKRRITVAVFAAAVTALTGASAFAKDGSPTLDQESARSASVFTASAAAPNDQAPSKSRYGKR
ncbi:MAG: hypothetical protein CVT81_14405 [Alphaproteobacteria bacterium HGW-Alphaproteobacteria-3]|nr:MAG: hypothetical protein CVT81_14405 [Alphaproteobacteria bacterium HGW-Alphaproteobacteria-3]